MAKYLRKCFKITAYDSPNIKYALAQQKAGIEPTNETLVPGVVTWFDLQKRLATWDVVRQTVGIFASWYEGADNLLFPPQWLDRSELYAASLSGQKRVAEAIGVDTAEGGDETSMTAVDRLGIIEQVGKKTPDTSVIPGEAIAFGRKHGVPAEMWVFDRGGGGKEHADALRRMGHNCRTVAFGEAVAEEPSYQEKFDKVMARIENAEERYVHVNRRAEMYWNLRWLIDPARALEGRDGFAIPSDMSELRRQLAPIPLTYDREGRHYLLPKQKKPGSHEKCLHDLIGCSPDRADSLVLAVWGMLNPKKKLQLKIW